LARRGRRVVADPKKPVAREAIIDFVGQMAASRPCLIRRSCTSGLTSTPDTIARDRWSRSCHDHFVLACVGLLPGLVRDARAVLRASRGHRRLLCGDRSKNARLQTRQHRRSGEPCDQRASDERDPGGRIGDVE
jgi:hypothetical protein